jgi:hypothetical protein
LDFHRIQLLIHLLLLDDFLRVRRGSNGAGALEKRVVRVDTGSDGEGDSSEPGAVAFF